VATSHCVEEAIRDYFDSRPGWKATKLAVSEGSAADFRISGPTDSFLCEVKSIGSPRANFPFIPYEFYREARSRKQDEIRTWTEQNPGRHLLLTPGQWEFIYGDEEAFRKKYQNRPRHTEWHFKQFTQELKSYFASSGVKDQPYVVRIDSDDLYVPTLSEKDFFFRWLESQIRAISDGRPSRCWHMSEERYSCCRTYSYFYRVHKPAYDSDTEAEYQLTVIGPLEESVLEVDAYSYGCLNFETIERNAKSALRQLASSASREDDQLMPRVIVLEGVDPAWDEWNDLLEYVATFLRAQTDLSAISILKWRLSHPEMLILPTFYVYHNPWIQHVRSLPISAFDDQWSVQLSPVKNPFAR
jgi:hypothetical protein